MKLADLMKFRRPKPVNADAYVEKLTSRGIDLETGHLLPDPTPMAPPIGYKKTPSMVELVREMVRSERLRQEAEAGGHESFEDAEDFDIGDDADELRSGYENDLDPGLPELLRAGAEEVERKKRSPKKDPQNASEKAGGEGGQSPPSDSSPSSGEA